MADPWKVLSEHEDLVLIKASIAERGRYYHRLRTIVLRAGMLIVEQRATLWHELIHAERGDASDCDNRSRHRQERHCVQEAARRGIGLDELADALRWTEDPYELADELKTTVEHVEVRLQHLHPSERGYLTRRVATKERSA